MRQILLRFDDICPTMDWGRWQKAKSVMDKYNVKALLGVIPNCEDPELFIDSPKKDFWDYLKNLQREGYVLAMHGVYHKYSSLKLGLINSGKDSEFAGLSYTEQYEKLNFGKESLEKNGISTDIFFAPSHSYDKNTIKALRNLGFKYISDGRSNKIINYKGIKAVPVKSFGVPQIKKHGNFVAIFHAHEWVRPEKVHGYDDLILLCKNYAEDIVDFYTYVNNMNVGLYGFQVLIEKLNVFYIRYLQKKVIGLWHFIKKILRRSK